MDEGLLEREPYQEPGQRTRLQYRLTEKGADLFPALVALMQWGDRWLGPGGVALAHRDCGEEIRVELQCAAGHRWRWGTSTWSGARRLPRAMTPRRNAA